MPTTIRIMVWAIFLLAQSWLLINRLDAQPSAPKRSVPKLTSRVYDETNTLGMNDKTQLERKLRAYEDSTSTQIVVVILTVLDGYEAGDFAIEVGQQNKIGQAKKDNGIVILVSMDDRKWFIATGFGIEPILPDTQVSLIGRNILVPALRNNDYYGGIDGTINEIIKALSGKFQALKRSERTPRMRDTSRPAPIH